MKKVYISGPITGIEDYQYNFHNASKMLAAKGFIPVDPCTLPHEHLGTYEEYMKEDLKALLDCDYIYMLRDWGKSKGANFEINTAMICGIKQIEDIDL